MGKHASKEFWCRVKELKKLDDLASEAFEKDDLDGFEMYSCEKRMKRRDLEKACKAVGMDVDTAIRLSYMDLETRSLAYRLAARLGLCYELKIEPRFGECRKKLVDH